MNLFNVLFNKLQEGSFDVDLHPLTLSFEGKLEKKFKLDYFSNSLGFLRISFLLGIIYYTLFGLLDSIALPEIKLQLHIIRFFFVIPVILVVFILSYLPSFRKWWQFAAFLTTVASGIGIVVMITIAPSIGKQTYYVGIILVLIYCYILIKLRFIWASLAGLTIISSYLIAHYLDLGENYDFFQINLFFLFSANFLGMFGSYCLEYYTRKEFYFRHRLNLESTNIKDTNLILESKVKEKTKKLEEDLQKIKIIEKNLRISEEKFRFLAENTVDVIWQTDLKLKFTYISPSIFTISGMTQDEWNETSLANHCSRKEFIHISRTALTGLKKHRANNTQLFESELLMKDGSSIPVEISGKVNYNNKGIPIGFQGITRDITERRIAEARIKNNLEEKNLLLKELYHRTKNNMQIIASMLRLQARNLDDADIQQAYKEIEDKIYSMSLVHQKLYEVKNLSKINISEYIKELTTQLIRTYWSIAKNVKMRYNMKDIFVSIDYAIPMGLIITELLTNSLRHSINQVENGEVMISLRRIDEETIELELSDNGLDAPTTEELRNLESLGLKNIFNLVEYQLQGNISTNSENGLEWKINFKDNTYKSRI